MKKCILQICAGNPYFNFLFCKFRSKIFHQEHFLNGLINQSLKYGMSPIKLSLLKYYHFNFHQPPLLWYTIYEISVKAHNLFLRPEIQGNLPSASTFLGCERGGEWEWRGSVRSCSMPWHSGDGLLICPVPSAVCRCHGRGRRGGVARSTELAEGGRPGSRPAVTFNLDLVSIGAGPPRRSGRRSAEAPDRPVSTVQDNIYPLSATTAVSTPVRPVSRPRWPE